MERLEGPVCEQTLQNATGCHAFRLEPAQVVFYVCAFVAKVHWMLNPYNMQEPLQRAGFIFAVINLARWFTLMTKYLPDRRFRVKLLEPWERGNVTITFQAGHR